jgi:hypothetical protein
MNIEERCPLDISLDLKNPTLQVQQASSYFIDIHYITLLQSTNCQELCTIEFNNNIIV